ncbi:uncharacterized protein TNCV_3953891 [Trichonephila clavipes]|nr:uncharacterized protein TNCV_3953891 [Trichonephila clavipes]
MENLSEDQCIEMEENIPQTPSDQQKCNHLKSIDRQIERFNIRKGYVAQLLDVVKRNPGPTPETTLKLEEAAGLDEQIKALEGNMSELLPCPVSLCAHNFKYKNNKKRSAEPIIRPAKLTFKNNNDNSKNMDDEEFKIPRKTSKGSNVPKEDSKIIATKNKFAALNSADKDVEDVTPAAPRIKPIMMKLFPEYNLILQEIHRTHPTATNTHVGGWIKIQAESSDHHREITLFLSDKKCQYYVTDPPANRPLKVVIKGLLATTDLEEIKKDLIDQGINILKIAQLRQFKTKSPLPIFMIEIARDENVDDIFKIKNCLYMQIKIDPFKKSPRPTQCYNCNFFHHASQNCSMKTRCLKCGEEHRTGQCSIKEKINNPTCINCNAKGHMASSTECPLFPKPRKGKGQPQKDNKKRNETTQASAAITTPGLSYAQAVQGKKPQQRAARGNDSSASNNENSNKFQGINLEAINASTGQDGEFSFLHAIFEMKKIFDYFPNLISEMKKSSQCSDPTDKLHCLLKGICVPQSPL